MTLVKGKGIAAIIYQTHAPVPNPSGAYIEMAQDGTVRLLGSADIGQGSTTVLAQIAAEELGVKLETISVTTADTDVTPYCSGTYSNRLTYVAGNAVKAAAAAAKASLFEAAADLLQTDPDNLEAQDGQVFIAGTRENGILISDVAGYCMFQKGKGIAGGSIFGPDIIPNDPETGQGAPVVAYVFGTHAAEVQVDTETGVVDVLKVTAAHDVGQAINPMLVEGQVEGGIQMGLGYALMEEILQDEKGNILNSSFTDYIVPTALDVPRKIDVHIVETHDPTGPYGAKGIGEACTLPVAPAIINAIYDAVGIRITSLPATPEKVLAAIQASKKTLTQESKWTSFISKILTRKK